MEPTPEQVLSTPIGDNDAGVATIREYLTLSFDHPNDETIRILVDNEVLVTVNHDEHGWAGMDIAVKVAKAIARKVGVWTTDD